MSGFEQFEACMQAILAEVKELRVEVKRSRGQEDMTRPLTAAELCERWHIAGATPALSLAYLARRCRAAGLTALKGGDGWNALYRRADVLRAEEYLAGCIRARKTKGGKKAA